MVGNPKDRFSHNMPQIIKNAYSWFVKKVPVHLSGFSQNTTFLSLEKYFKNQEKCLKTVKLVLANKLNVKSLDYKLRLQKRKFLGIKCITNFRNLI